MLGKFVRRHERGMLVLVRIAMLHASAKLVVRYCLCYPSDQREDHPRRLR